MLTRTEFKARDVATVVTSDFSAGLRVLATEYGADIVIGPGQESPCALPPGEDSIRNLSNLLELSVGTREKLGKLPIHWQSHGVWLKSSEQRHPSIWSP